MAFQLTNENYYTNEADRLFMSNSQYQSWRKCEAMTYAKIFLDWQEPEMEVDLVGNYFHSANEGDEALERFKKNHPEIVSSQGPTKGQLKSNYLLADKMIWTMLHDDLMKLALEGEKEKIVSGFWAGTNWKCKLDSLNREKGRFCDLKSARDLYHTEWDDTNKRRVHFVEFYGYLQQLAIYSQIEMIDAGRDYWLDAFMAIVTKQDPPDKLVLSFAKDRLEYALGMVEENMPRILAVKSGKESPKRCERCAYCRETKQLEKVSDFDEHFYGVRFYEI
jgi:hypothetical protein